MKFYTIVNKIYTLLPTFVEIYPKMTNLYRFNNENPYFAVTQHWLQADCPWFIENYQCLFNGPQTLHI